MNKVFLDVNVLLEVLLDRRLADECIAALEDPARQYGISALSVHIVWYVAEKYKLDRAKIDDVLSAWEVLPITNHVVTLARKRYDGKDFEDCLQAACAEEADYQSVLTIDKKFKEHSGTRLPVSLLSARR